MNGPFPGLSSVAALIFIGVAASVLSILAVVPIALEARQERAWRRELLAKVDWLNEAQLNHD